MRGAYTFFVESRQNAGWFRRSLVVSCALLAGTVEASAPPNIRLRCETLQDSTAQGKSILLSDLNPGRLLFPARSANRSSWRFNGRSSIVYAVASHHEGFAENFTWEGFFLSPRSNSFLSETGIADRVVTLFAFDQGN